MSSSDVEIHEIAGYSNDAISTFFQMLKQKQLAYENADEHENVELPKVLLNLGCLDELLDDDDQNYVSIMNGLESVADSGIVWGVRFDGSFLDSSISRGDLDRMTNTIASIPSLTKIEWDVERDHEIEHEDYIEIVTNMLLRTSSLETLECNGLRLAETPNEIENFADSIRGTTTLKEVKFTGGLFNSSCWTIQNVGQVLESLAALPHLKKLSLVGMVLKRPSSIDSLSSTNSSFLKIFDHPGLKTFHLPSTYWVDDTILHSISSGLLTSPAISDLSLVTPLGANECHLLSEIIRCNHVLNALRLYTPCIGQYCHVLPIIDALEANTTLRTLLIATMDFQSGVPFFYDSDTHEAFLSMIQQKNYALAGLRFLSFDVQAPSTQNHLVDHEINKKIAFYAKLNLEGRKDLLRTSTASIDLLAEYLISNSDDLDILFYYLSMVPGLLFG
ncbi:expressed unknown protein [Seminavis robusta]|uniref:Uncharacterized protein n=1 Tax=Seminavis robusta TaxID=568900 RepID=A0A9N8HAX3_9STRA|nr:expressed unknown protein [Seminavis robusta]|eukprot:Sro337_g120690.1 n/a (446) ;mRNA; f:55209-56546